MSTDPSMAASACRMSCTHVLGWEQDELCKRRRAFRRSDFIIGCNFACRHNQTSAKKLPTGLQLSRAQEHRPSLILNNL